MKKKRSPRSPPSPCKLHIHRRFYRAFCMTIHIRFARRQDVSPQSPSKNPRCHIRFLQSGIGTSFAKPTAVGLYLKSGILSRLFKSPANGDDVHGMNVVAFLKDLVAVAPPAGGGNYGFKKPDGHSRGFVQLICSERVVRIHRIWASEPGTGAGSIMMRTLCDIADRHGVEMKLKVIPIGRKPFPMCAKSSRHGINALTLRVIAGP